MLFPRISFNAPVTLVFSTVSLLFMLIVVLVPDTLDWFDLAGPVRVQWEYFLGYLSYPFAHVSWIHYFGNFSIILLIGPILEEKYSSKFIFWGYFLTSLAIGFFHTILFPEGIVGASGLVFFSIVLVSMTNFHKGQIPMTLILVALLYLGKEVAGLFYEDQISQFGHLFGGLCGALAGYWAGKSD